MSIQNSVNGSVADLTHERRLKTSIALDDSSEIGPTAQIDHRAWAEYQLIGDCLRSADLADAASFQRQQRLLAALQAEPPLQPMPHPRHAHTKAAALAGAAMQSGPTQEQVRLLEPRESQRKGIWWARYGAGGLAAAAAAALVFVVVPAVQQPSGPAPSQFVAAPSQISSLSEGAQRVPPADASAMAAYLHAHRVQSPSSVRPAGFESGLIPVSAGGVQRP